MKKTNNYFFGHIKVFIFTNSKQSLFYKSFEEKHVFIAVFDQVVTFVSVLARHTSSLNTFDSLYRSSVF